MQRGKNVEETGSATTSYLKRRVQTPYPVSHVWSVIARPATKWKNIGLTLRTIPDLCKNDLHPVIFGSDGNSYTTSTQSDMCIYTYILRTIETLVGQN